MNENVVLRVGGRETSFTRSDTLLAARPSAMMRFTLRSLPSDGGQPPELMGRLGAFEILRIDAGGLRTLLSRSTSFLETRRVYHTSEDGVPFVPTGRIMLSLSGELSEQSNTFLNRIGLTLTETAGEAQFSAHTRADPVEVCRRLQDDASIRFAEPDLATFWTPHSLDDFDDARFKDQWHLKNNGFHYGHSFKFKLGADARVVSAWQKMQAFGDDAVILGVADDGFDLGHPDLSGKALSPWDVDSDSDDVSPRHYGYGQVDGHGTGCSGLALGALNGGEIIGVAPRARLMPVRVGPDFDSKKLVRIFRYLAENGAWIVSCSWGPTAKHFPLTEEASAAISYCVRHGRRGLGTPVLFSAGNSGHPIDGDGWLNGLAAHPDVICVSASTSEDKFASFSSWGPEVSVCAPSSGSGWSLTTADVTGFVSGPNGEQYPKGAPGDYTNQFTGTSGACAIAAGVCALVLSAAPNLTSDQVRDILQRTARQLAPSDDGASAKSLHFGHGCVNAESAVDWALRLKSVS